MCLIFVAHQMHERYRLVVVANRDEYHARPTQPAAFWPQAPTLLAGRDLEAGGTWLGITKRGRFAAVTNYRDAEPRQSSAKSRGELVFDFLVSAEPPPDYATRLSANANGYNGFGLLAGDGCELWYCSNRVAGPRKLAPGVYGLSNHLLDTPWPKVERGKALFWALLRSKKLAAVKLLDMMHDSTQTPQASHGTTGADHGFERALSAMFVRSTHYGTRSTTVVLVQHGGEVEFVERSFPPGVASTRDCRYRFRLEQSSPAEV